MSVSELGNVEDLRDWHRPVEKPVLGRVARGLIRFARRKPLGFVCGVIIVSLMIVGDLVPETINKFSQIARVGDQPVPYLADVMEEHLDFVYPYEEQDLRARLQGSSSQHLLGTDHLGRDTFSRLLYGTRPVVVVSFAATFLAAVLNILLSVPAGYYGGWYDKLTYRLLDVVEALPTLVILIAILGVFGSGLWPMVLVIGVVTGFGGRPLRGQTISIMQSPFIEAGRVVGARDMRLMLRYVLPSLMPLIILMSSLRLGTIVLAEATLSFLGFGIPPPFPSWGQMLSLEGRQWMKVVPGLALYPGIAIAILVFSFNLLGDALRDVLDPRLRGRR